MNKFKWLKFITYGLVVSVLYALVIFTLFLVGTDSLIHAESNPEYKVTLFEKSANFIAIIIIQPFGYYYRSIDPHTPNYAIEVAIFTCLLWGFTLTSIIFFFKNRKKPSERTCETNQDEHK
jgi:hypothetical protein